MAHVSRRVQTDIFEQLEFEATDGWQPLPKWTRSFYDVGRWVAGEEDSAQRAIIAISIPTRTFAAVSTALGVVSANARRAVAESPALDYFRFLLTLPAGEAGVLLTENGRQFVGIIDGTIPAAGQEWLKIRIENGRNSALWRSVKPANAKSIQLAQVTMADLPLRQTGRRTGVAGDFSRHFLPELEFVSFSPDSILDCTLVGRQSFFLEELIATKIRLDLGFSQQIDGCLQDVVRAFPLRLGRLSPRTEIWKLSTHNGENVPRSSRIAVFDGATSFLRCNSSFPDAHWVVLLDRTDPNCEAGFDEINARYVQNRLTDYTSDRPFPSLPGGVDASVFWEESK